MSIETKSSRSFNIGFTAASLRPELVRVVAEDFLACGDWDQTKEKILGDNSLQARSRATSARMEREFRHRLQTLTHRQLELLANGSAEIRRAIAWLAVLKRSDFIFRFAADTLREKLAALDPILRPSDYEQFFESQASAHPELAKFTASTKEKICRVVKKMLREVGILSESKSGNVLVRPVLPHEIVSAISSDNRRWLAGFLIPNSEIKRLLGESFSA